MKKRFLLIALLVLSMVLTTGCSGLIPSMSSGSSNSTTGSNGGFSFGNKNKDESSEEESSEEESSEEESIEEESSEESLEPADSADPEEEVGLFESFTGKEYHKNVGETLSSSFFDFTVDSAVISDEYTASEGTVVWDVTITTKNTFGEDLPMFNSDFILFYGDTEEDYSLGSIPDSEDDPDGLSMPEEWTLAVDESATYHIYFITPEDVDQLWFLYLEVYADDTTGDAYVVDIDN